jgi:hypothetical protein
MHCHYLCGCLWYIQNPGLWDDAPHTPYGTVVFITRWVKNMKKRKRKSEGIRRKDKGETEAKRVK